MNTIPDEALLALWLDDELHGDELASVDAWALGQPEQLAAREEIRSWRESIAAVMPAEIEPPYPDFFNSRIEKAIREQSVETAKPVIVPAASKASFWRSWVFPATAFAGMALAFWVGTKANSINQGAPQIVKIEESGPTPVYYTPEQGVNAEWVKGSGGSSSVIVLQGVSAIPDSLDFSETVINQTPSSYDSTADAKISEPGRSAR